MKERPIEMPKCHEHDNDNKLKYWCEHCSKEICGNCQEFKHKDHQVILINDYVKSLKEHVRIDRQINYEMIFISIVFYSVKII